MSAAPPPAPEARRLALQPWSAALISLGVGLGISGGGQLTFVIAVPAVILLSSLGFGGRPALARTAAAARPALLALLVGSLRWEQSLLLYDERSYVDPVRIGAWALDHVAQGEATVGGLFLAAALGLARLDGRASAVGIGQLAVAAALALGAERLVAAATALLAGAHHLPAELLFLALGPLPAAALGLGLAAAALRRGERRAAGSALAVGLCLTLSAALPAPRLHLMLAGVPELPEGLPRGPLGPAAQGTPIDLRQNNVNDILLAHRRTKVRGPLPPIEAEAGACRAGDARWARLPRAAELLAAPAAGDAAALLADMAPLRAWSVDRVALLGQADRAPTLLSALSGAGPLWSRPAARLLLDRPPQGARLLRLDAAGLQPPAAGLAGPASPCALHVVPGATVQQLWSAARALTEGPEAPCSGLSLSARPLLDADLCPPEG